MNSGWIASYVGGPSLTIKIGHSKVIIPKRFVEYDMRDVKKIKIHHEDKLSDEFPRKYLERYIKVLHSSIDEEEAENDPDYSYLTPRFGEQDIRAAVKLTIVLKSIDLLVYIAEECIEDNHIEAYKDILKSYVFWSDFLHSISITENVVHVIFDHPNQEYERLLMEYADKQVNRSYIKDLIFDRIRRAGIEPRIPGVLKEYKYYLKYNHPEKD